MSLTFFRRLKYVAPVSVVAAMLPMAAAGAAVHTNTMVASQNQANLENVVASCASGTLGISGGFDLPGANGAVPVLESGPLIQSKTIDQFPDGPANFEINGWDTIVSNPAGAPAQLAKSGVICRETEGTVGSDSPVVVSGTVPALQRVTFTAQCPTGTVWTTAIGGAWNTINPAGVESSFPTINGSPLASVADGTYGGPSAWSVTEANPSNNDAKSWMAVLCTDQGVYGPPTTVVQSVTVGPDAVGGTLVACPARTEAVGGGVASDPGVQLVTDGPSAQGRLGGLSDGPAGSSDGWSGSMFNSTTSPATVKVAAVCLPTMVAVGRIGGTDRIQTAINVSQLEFPTGGTAATAVVLARSDPNQFADALVGQPLAVAKGAPILLTPSTALDGRDATEMKRLIPTGSTVYLLGGTVALTPDVANAVIALGYNVVRFGGADRFETATIIADQGLGDPSTVLESDGLNFPDALSAGVAASKLKGAVLLTSGTGQAAATASYLAAHNPATRFAIGGGATAADPSATSVSGPDRFATSSAVATRFFPAPSVAGFATGLDYPDALAGGARMGSLGGPLLLVNPDSVPPPVAAYLQANASSLGSGPGGELFGGTSAVSEATRVAIGQDMNP
jgi:hypothetical protein